MPIDASSDPYDAAGLEPAKDLGVLPAQPGDDDDLDLDLDDAGTGASGKFTVTEALEDESGGDVKAGGLGVDLDDAGSGADVKDGLSLDLGADDGPGDDGLGDLTDPKFDSLSASDDDDLDLDAAGSGSGAKVDLGDDGDLDDPKGDLSLDLGDDGGADDGLGDDLKVGFGTDEVDADLGSPIEGQLDLDDDPLGDDGLGDDDLDDPGDVKSLGDELHDLF